MFHVIFFIREDFFRWRVGGGGGGVVLRLPDVFFFILENLSINCSILKNVLISFMLLRVCNQAKRLFPTMYPYALLWLRLVLGLNV